MAFSPRPRNGEEEYDKCVLSTVTGMNVVPLSGRPEEETVQTDRERERLPTVSERGKKDEQLMTLLTTLRKPTHYVSSWVTTNPFCKRNPSRGGHSTRDKME